MATTSEADIIQQEITEKGFWTSEDADIGRRLDYLVSAAIPLKSEQGLDLIIAALKKPVRDVIWFFFPQSVLAFYKLFGQTTLDHCFFVAPNMKVLLVYAFSSKSKITFYSGSHLLQLKAVDIGKVALTKEDESYKIPGATQISLENGGVAITDARIWWTVELGKNVDLGFMTPDEAKEWEPMEIPRALESKLGEVRRNIAEMLSDTPTQTIGLNYKFKDQSRKSI